LIYHTYPPLTGILTGGPLSICAGLPVNLAMETAGGNSDSYVFNWSSGNSQSASVSFIPSATNFYSSTVDDACYDPVTDSIFIEVLPVPVSDFTWAPSNPSVFLPHVQFTDLSVNAISWNWSLDSITQTGEQHPSHDYAHSGSYPVKLITANQYQCTDTLIKILEIEQIITAYFPNSFTPNGDGINDVFGLTGFDTGGYVMSIYNRWGKEVFHSGGGFEKWNGKDSGGRLHPEGVYVYSVTIVNDLSKKPYVGTLTLIR
jgi:gliding motility-associated-like protein